MRALLAFALIIALAGTVLATDLGSQRPEKPDMTYPPSVVDPDRQGNDTVDNAVVIEVPYSGSGTTVGYADDYDEICPYSGSTSPDVVYKVTPDEAIAVNIDLFGSTYDTKVYVYDQSLNLVACNDDYYPDYVSKLENVPMAADVPYYIIVDGYGGASGNYEIGVVPYEPCVIDCPAGAELEGEPPLVDGYADAHNGGCNSPEFSNPFGAITAPIFCGVSGWYLSSGGSQYRDTDWFEIVVPDVGFVFIIGDAEQPTYMFELAPQDCGSVGVVQEVIMGPCTIAEITINGAPGSTIWFWVGPTTFEGPVPEYNYVLLTNLGGIATEARSWTGVKSLFN